MKTIQELYNEIMASKELKAQAVEAAKAGKLEAFLKEHACGATMEEVTAFLIEKANADAPLSSKKLENAAGGGCNGITRGEVGLSIVGLLGVYCAITAAVSAGTGYVGQKKENEGRLCNT